MILAINTWAVSVIRYSVGILKWNVEDKDQLDSKTRKLMTMHKALHPKADVKQLYMKRKAGGRGLISAKECIENERRTLNYYDVNS